MTKTLLVILLLSTFPSAYGGQYRLIKGEGIEVCEAYAKNLNSFENRFPMWCERKLNPAMSDFSKPLWEKMDPREHMDLLKTIERDFDFLLFGDINRNLKEWERYTNGKIEIAHLRMWQTRVDINNDGQADNLIKLHEGDCPSTRHFAIALLLLNESKTAIDIKSVHLFQNINATTSVGGGTGFAMYDVFAYKDKVYFDRWSQSKIETGFLRVFVTEHFVPGGFTEEICTYRSSPPNNWLITYPTKSQPRSQRHGIASHE